MTAVPILEPLRAEPRRAALLFDVDGTLAPIVDDPAAPRCRRRPRRCWPSSRAATDSSPASPGARRSPPARWSGLPSSPTRVITASSCCARARSARASTPGSPTVPGRSRGSSQASIASGSRERGSSSRTRARSRRSTGARAAESRTAEQRAAEIAAAAEGAGLVPHRGRMVLELRPLASVDKGVATRRLVVDSGATAAMFAGDDRTDLDAFAALRALRAEGALRAAACVGIDSAEAPPELAREADLMVAGPAAFLDVLRSRLNAVLRPAAGLGATRRRRCDRARRGQRRRRQPGRRRVRARVRGRVVGLRRSARCLARPPGARGGRDVAGARRCAHRDQPAVREPGPDRDHAAVADRQRSRSWSGSPAGSPRRSPRSAPATRS